MVACPKRKVIAAGARLRAPHARIATLWCAMRNGAHVLGCSLTRAAEVRSNLPYGLATCGVLLVLMAFINHGDSAFTKQLVRSQGAHETQANYSTVMQSMPSTSRHQLRHHPHHTMECAVTSSCPHSLLMWGMVKQPERNQERPNRSSGRVVQVLRMIF
eukprot:1050465-Pleurochrysis_carterae.AAC.5